MSTSFCPARRRSSASASGSVSGAGQAQSRRLTDLVWQRRLRQFVQRGEPGRGEHALDFGRRRADVPGGKGVARGRALGLLRLVVNGCHEGSLLTPGPSSWPGIATVGHATGGLLAARADRRHSPSVIAT